jgi:hypothetical protein
VSVVRTGLLFWFLVICAVGFALYFLLARQSGDLPLAFAAAVAFVLNCAAALIELLGRLP